MPSRCTLLACAFAYTLGGPLGERHFDLDSSTPGSLCAPTRFDFRFNGLGGFGELCSLAKLELFLPESLFMSTTFLRTKLRFNKMNRWVGMGGGPSRGSLSLGSVFKELKKGRWKKSQIYSTHGVGYPDIFGRIPGAIS
jgi:hypothetical protein